MALDFKNVSGSAKSKKIDYLKFVDGDNEFRMVGGVLPRYVYWHKTLAGTPIALECLDFDRDKEEFTHKEKDYFKEYFPDIKCKWSYVVQAFDKSGKLVVVSLRKQMFESIIQNATKHWGDPTDPDKGFKIVVVKKKTGPNVFNVSYELDVLGCKEQPLTDAQKEIVSASPTIDELFPRQTPDEQKENIERVWFSTKDEEATEEDEDPFSTAKDEDDLTF